MCIHMYTYLYIHIHIYIYEREKEREGEKDNERMGSIEGEAKRDIRTEVYFKEVAEADNANILRSHRQVADPGKNCYSWSSKVIRPTKFLLFKGGSQYFPYNLQPNARGQPTLWKVMHVT